MADESGNEYTLGIVLAYVEMRDAMAAVANTTTDPRLLGGASTSHADEISRAVGRARRVFHEKYAPVVPVELRKMMPLAEDKRMLDFESDLEVASEDSD